MKCTQCDCTAELGPNDLFCGDCGHPASDHVATEAVTPTPDIPPTPPSPGPHIQQGTYSAEISRQNPGCLIFLVDQSGSMEETIAGGTGEKKKQAVADAINRLLYNIVLRCTKEDGVRPYFDIGVWTYGGASQVRRAFNLDLMSISDAAEQPKRVETRRRRVPDGAGGIYEEAFELPVWFDPVAHGNTPMNTAFSAVVAPLHGWLSQYPNSFPPIVINLTDGAYTDDDPAPVVWELMQLGTSDGNVLVFNCHISAQAGQEVTFPDDTQAAGLEGLARELCDMSSQLPEPMRRQAQAKGYAVGPSARGYAFNADLVTLIDFLDIGTRVVQDRMETG
ncbi:MAG: vWA domain-containing protein [Anaerolineae bacterium]